VAKDFDWLFYSILSLSVVLFLGLVTVLVVFVVRYRHREGHEPQPSPDSSTAFQVTWIIVPAVIAIILFVSGWRTYADMITPPRQAIDISVSAKEWSWHFTEPNGARDTVLHVPVNEPVRLRMTSYAFAHTFQVPAFRINEAVVPGRETTTWFTATEPGIYRANCAAYCGSGHADMKTNVVVHETAAAYQEYLLSKESERSPAEIGAEVYVARGCKACHTLDGKKLTGPTFKGLFGKQEKLKGGGTVLVDEAYLIESILKPQASVVEGFQPIMPAFEGQLTDREIEGLVEFIKTLE
jgi:cytochrome c oxidase subunit 2